MRGMSYFIDPKPRFLSMERRQFEEPSASDDASLCFFIQEKDETSQISCKHRLARSKFNYNPFGLRFGKRNEATTSDSDRLKHKHLLPMMLYLRKQLETSWNSVFVRRMWFSWLKTWGNYDSGTLCLLLCFYGILRRTLFYWVIVFVQ